MEEDQSTLPDMRSDVGVPIESSACSFARCRVVREATFFQRTSRAPDPQLHGELRALNLLGGWWLPIAFRPKRPSSPDTQLDEAM